MVISLPIQKNIKDRELTSFVEWLVFQKDSKKAVMITEKWQNHLQILLSLISCAVLPLYFGEINHLVCENVQVVQGLPILIFLIKFFIFCVKISLLRTPFMIHVFYIFKIIYSNLIEKDICIFIEKKKKLNLLSTEKQPIYWSIWCVILLFS